MIFRVSPNAGSSRKKLGFSKKPSFCFSPALQQPGPDLTSGLRREHALDKIAHVSDG